MSETENQDSPQSLEFIADSLDEMTPYEKKQKELTECLAQFTSCDGHDGTVKDAMRMVCLLRDTYAAIVKEQHEVLTDLRADLPRMAKEWAQDRKASAQKDVEIANLKLTIEELKGLPRTAEEASASQEHIASAQKDVEIAELKLKIEETNLQKFEIEQLNRQLKDDNANLKFRLSQGAR